MRWAGVGLATAIIAGLLAGCGSPAANPAWQPVGLPGGSWPSSLAVVGDRLLVGGFDPAAGAPALTWLDAGGQTEPLDLAPVQDYAKVADLVSVSPAGEAAVALGVARGGAHGNERWTIWDGDLAGTLTDHEQDFWTFGGHEAGPLLAVVRPDGEPVIVGSRGGAGGFYAALWTRRATTWTRHPVADPGLQSGPDRVLSFRSATSGSGTILITGAEVGLAGGVSQSPVAWLGSVAGPWRTVMLPVPDELATAGGLAQATSAACGQAAGATCWVAGWVRGRPVVWELEPASGQATATVLPGTGGGGTDPVGVVGLVGDVPVVLTNADEPLLAWRCAGDWRTAPAPASLGASLIGLGTRVYAVTGDEQGHQLWRAELDTRGC